MTETTMRLWELREKINDPSLDPQDTTNVTEIVIKRGNWPVVCVLTDSSDYDSASWKDAELTRLKRAVSRLEDQLASREDDIKRLQAGQPALR